MPVLNAVAVADTYAASAAKLTDVWNSRGGWYSVSGASVFVQAQYGPRGDSHFTEEIEFGNGAFVLVPASCVGLQFRNAVAGQVATVTAQIAQGPEPPFQVSALGTVTTTSSNVITQTIITVTGTYSTPAGAVAIFVECIGDGGAGGGVPITNASQSSAGGGGGGGGYGAKLITGPAASYAAAVGQGGVPAAGANGGDGSGVTFGTAPTPASAEGGKGGTAGQATAGPFVVSGGRGGGAGQTGTITLAGGGGAPGLTAAANQPMPGNGGSAARGSGGPRTVLGSFAGTPGGIGAGGSGASANINNAGALAGGAGGAGLIIVTEFY